MRLLTVLVLLALLCQCERRESAKPAPAKPVPSAAIETAAPSAQASRLTGQKPERFAGETRTWIYEKTALGTMHVVVSIPPHDANQEFPVLIALHGRGEAMKGPARGARGWIDDYGLGRALTRLKHPPLAVEDFGGTVEPTRLERLNQALKQDPYGGLVVVCPYTPDLLAGERAFGAARPLAELLVERILPRAYAETPALATAKTTGIDGVSLGGRAALLVGFERPEAFGAVAGLQAAFDPKEISKLSELAAAAKQRNPELSLRLLTSDADYFLDVNRALSRALRERAVEHSLTVVRGDHSYEFNRGPGVFEMLTHHDRVLRGHPAL